MATIDFQSYIGAGPGWANNGANTLIFSGSPTDLTAPIMVGQFQDGTHLGNGDPGADQCGANHANNVKYVDGTHFILNGGASEILNDTNLLADECTMRIHFNHTSAVVVSGVSFYCFDGVTPTNPATGMDVYAFEQGQGNTAWTLLNDASGAVGGSGDALALADSASATDHYWYLALSASPESVGGKSAFDFYVSLAYS